MEQAITFCLWMNQTAEEAATFYTETFPNASVTNIHRSPLDTPAVPAGSVLTTSFTIENLSFLALNGGSIYSPNPSISFTLHSDSREEIKTLWDKLSHGGTVLMELQSYPYSDYYGWVQDKYGVSWQLMLNNPEHGPQPRLMPCLLFVNKAFGHAEDAMNRYTSIFPDSKIGMVEKQGPDKSEGKILYADFSILGNSFSIMEDSHAHAFGFNEGISIMVFCDTQKEVDTYWNELLAGGGKELACGWLIDRYGIAWQIVPRILMRQMESTNANIATQTMRAMMDMIKLDIQKIEEAAKG